MGSKEKSASMHKLLVDTLLSPTHGMQPLSPSLRKRGSFAEYPHTSSIDNEDCLSPRAAVRKELKRTASTSSFNVIPFVDDTAKNEYGFGETFAGEPEDMKGTLESSRNEYIKPNSESSPDPNEETLHIQDQHYHHHHDHQHADHHHHDHQHADHHHHNQHHHQHGHHHAHDDHNHDSHDSHAHSDHDSHEPTQSLTHNHRQHAHSHSSLHKRNRSKDRMGDPIPSEHQDLISNLKDRKKNQNKRGHHRIHSLSHSFFQSGPHKSSKAGPPEMLLSTFPSLFEIVQNSSPAFKRYLVWGCFHFLVGGTLWIKGQFGDSLAVTGFGYMVVFDALGVFARFLSQIIADDQERRQPSIREAFGMRRYEVLVLFANSIYLLFAAMYMSKESLEHLMLETAYHDDGEDLGESIEIVLPNVPYFLLFGGFACTVISAIGFRNHEELIQLITKRRTYHKSSITVHSLKSRFNMLFNSGLVLSTVLFGAAVLFIGSLEPTPMLATLDKSVAFLESFIMFYIGIPAAMGLGKILLQTAPEELASKMEEALREVQYSTSVLTLHTIHLWQSNFRHVIGTVHVHIRPDANEEQMLEDIRRKLDNVVGDDKGGLGEISIRVIKGL